MIGVLAMQGAFAEHIRALEESGARTRMVRTREDLEGLDGLVLPGGESTTMTMLMERVGLLEPLRGAIEHGLPVLATCAGMIVLANEITDAMEGQRGLGLLDIEVRRNGYGRQVDSFEADLPVDGLGEGPFHAVFIRAPLLTRAGQGVHVLAQLPDGRMVAAEQGNLLATAFHPELTDDKRFHEYFLKLAHK